MATLPSFFAKRGGAAGFGFALSPTKRSRRPMPTDSTFFAITHCASHCDSCGQTRPQIEGNAFASLMTSSAPSKSRTSDVLDEARDVDRHRAARDAGRLRALDAALRLAEGVLERVAEVHLLEVARPLERVALRHVRLLRREVLDLAVVLLVLLEELLLEVADVRVVLGRARLLALEALLPGEELLEVDLVAVEVRPLDAGELRPCRPP